MLADLTIIILATFFAGGMAPLLAPAVNRMSGLPAILALAAVQFAMAGLGPVIVMLWRRRGFAWYGLRTAGTARSVALGLLWSVLYVVVTAVLRGHLAWLPLRNLTSTQWSLALGWPLGALGLAITIIAWGFFEAYTSIFMAHTINQLGRRPARSAFLALGPWITAVLYGLIHLAMGQGLIGFVTSLLSTYFITVTPLLAGGGNAWGGILIQVLTNGLG